MTRDDRIEELRAELDELDRELVELLNRRARVVERVREVK